MRETLAEPAWISGSNRHFPGRHGTRRARQDAAADPPAQPGRDARRRILPLAAPIASIRAARPIDHHKGIPMKRFLVLAFATFALALAAMRPAAAEQGCPDGYTMAALGTAQCIPIPGLCQFPAALAAAAAGSPPVRWEERWGRSPSIPSRARPGSRAAASRRQAEDDAVAICRQKAAAAPASWKSPTPINAASSSGAITGRSPSSRPRWNKPRSWRSISATATAAAPARSFLGLQHARAGAIGRGRRGGAQALAGAISSKRSLIRSSRVRIRALAECRWPYTASSCRAPAAIPAAPPPAGPPPDPPGGTGRQDRVSDTLARARQRQRAAVDAVAAARRHLHHASGGVHETPGAVLATRAQGRDAGQRLGCAVRVGMPLRAISGRGDVRLGRLAVPA